MTLALPIDWWLAPLAFTAVALAWAFWTRADEARRTGSMFDGLGQAIGLAIRVPAATAASLAVWLIWSLLT